MVLWVWLPDCIALNITRIEGAQLTSDPSNLIMQWSGDTIGNGV